MFLSAESMYYIWNFLHFYYFPGWFQNQLRALKSINRYFFLWSGLCSSPDIIPGEANRSKSTYKVIFWSLGIEFVTFNSTELYRQVYRFSLKNTEQLTTTCPRVCRAWQKLQYGLVLNFHLNVFVAFAKVLFKYLITKL